MLNEVNNLTNGVNPESIMIDFESTMLGARERVYPLVQKKNVFVHLTKNICRKVQEFGLCQEYLNNEQFRSNIRMIGIKFCAYCRYYSGIYRTGESYFVSEKLLIAK